MNQIIVSDQTPDYDWAVDKVMDVLKPSTRRVYGSTYASYGNWCELNDLPPLPLNIEAVKQFIIEQPVTMVSRKRIMSALRKLAWFMALDFNSPINKAVYEYLLKMPVPEENAGGKPRDKTVFSESEIKRIMDTWDGSDAIHVRNRALIRLLLAFGGRRSEVAALRWRDIDLDKGTIHIEHGKGDKKRESIILGNRPLDSLREWMETQGVIESGYGEKQPAFEYVFTPVSTNGKTLGEDRPITGDTVYLIVLNTQEQCGVALHPHKFRGTMITILLEDGNSLPDVRDQAGHRFGSTTMGYAVKADAIALKKRMKVRWQ